MSTSDDWEMTDQPCPQCGAQLAKQAVPDGSAQSTEPAGVAVRTRCTNDACPESRR